MEECGTGNDFHRRDPPVGVNQGVDANVTRDVLVFGHERIEGVDLTGQFCRLYISTDGKRRFRSRGLFSISCGKSGIESPYNRVGVTGGN